MLNSAPSFHYSACLNSCEVDSILHEEMKAHKATCSLEEMKCPNGCGKVLQRQSMGNYTEVECPVDCQYSQLELRRV